MAADLDLRFSSSALGRTEGPVKLENSQGAHESGGVRAVYFRVSEELIARREREKDLLRWGEDSGSCVGIGRKILTTEDTEEHGETQGKLRNHYQ